MDVTILEAVRSGDRKALSRAITLVERGEALDDSARLPKVMGITGPQGAGK
jgi:putative protein kinase ArgK-like GTPase of G3E family